MNEVPRSGWERGGYNCPAGHFINGFAIEYFPMLGVTGFAIDCREKQGDGQE